MRIGGLFAAAGAALSVALGARAADPAPAPPLSPDDGRAIAAAIERARGEGIDAPSAGVALAGLSSADPAVRETADASLSAFATSIAAAEHGQRINPPSVDRNFALRPAYDAASDFAAARRSGRVAAWVAALAPTDPLFVNLVAARQRYAAIVAKGGWPTIPAGAAPKLGAAEPRAPLLAVRLNIEGYDVESSVVGASPPAGATTLAPARAPTFDAALATALRAFQVDHGLKADGVLSAATLAALDVPANDRLAAIDANLERERWLPHVLPADRIEVDTGDPQATLFRDGQAILTMRAIVGQPTKQTPTFASQVVAIVFNPPWVVPADIAAKELFPKERRSPGYLAKNDFYVANGQLIQRAGPKASLGYLKFDIPDPFDVYLHDTPARSLFALPRRWLSHGCVRLQNPRDLAAALLAQQGWDRAAVDAAITENDTHSVRLAKPAPVFVVYRTVVADAAGHASFRPDTYGWDAELEAALAAAKP